VDPKIYVAKYTTNGSGTWTCPAGVTQIKLTLIGAGGAGGIAQATATSKLNSAVSSIAAPEGTAGSTTFVVSGTTYTALGGTVGQSHEQTVNDSYFQDGRVSGGSGSTSSELTAENRYPGSGGVGGKTTAYASTLYELLSGDFFQSRVETKAQSSRGQDGVIEVFQVTVVPSNVYSFTVGTAAGYTGTTYPMMGSNGAVIIEYVV
jgi:hypothetical protein